MKHVRIPIAVFALAEMNSSNTGLTQLTDFGTPVKSWMASKASSDWVQ